MPDPSGPVIRWRSADRDDVAVTFSQPERPFGDGVLDLRVDVSGPDLAAGAWVRTVDGDGLAGFLQGLVADFRGWCGPRRWRSLEGVLSMEARHLGRRVRLQVEVAGDDAADPWRVTVPLLVTPGEDLVALARGMASLLAPGR